MITIFSFIFVLLVIVNFEYISPIFVDYTKYCGEITDNFGKGRYEISFKNNNFVVGKVIANSENYYIPEGSIVKIEKIGFLKYKIISYIYY